MAHNLWVIVCDSWACWLQFLDCGLWVLGCGLLGLGLWVVGQELWRQVTILPWVVGVGRRGPWVAAQWRHWLARIRPGRHTGISLAGIWENKFGVSGKQIRRYFPLHRRLYRSAALCEVHGPPFCQLDFLFSVCEHCQPIVDPLAMPSFAATLPSIMNFCHIWWRLWWWQWWQALGRDYKMRGKLEASHHFKPVRLCQLQLPSLQLCVWSSS